MSTILTLQLTLANLPAWLYARDRSCSLVQSTSKQRGACISGKTFECDLSSGTPSITVQGACRGLFYCNGELAQCGPCLGGTACAKVSPTTKTHCKCSKSNLAKQAPIRCAYRPSAEDDCLDGNCTRAWPPSVDVAATRVRHPRAADSAMVAARCALERSASQWCEDVILLPTLLHAAAPGHGTFIEIGGLDGRTFSNTAMLEECFGWKGLLIEPNVVNFFKLDHSSGRLAQRVHSGVCATPGNLSFTILGGAMAADVSHMSHRLQSMHAGAAKATVPCAPLSSLMHSHGLPTATLLSLDVEGAEDLVLGTVDPAAFKIIMVESDGFNRATEARVHEIITGAGLKQSLELDVPKSRVYIRADVVPKVVKDTSVLRPRPTLPTLASVLGS